MIFFFKNGRNWILTCILTCTEEVKSPSFFNISTTLIRIKVKANVERESIFIIETHQTGPQFQKIIHF